MPVNVRQFRGIIVRFGVFISVLTPLVFAQFVSPKIPSVIDGPQTVFQFGWPFAGVLRAEQHFSDGSRTLHDPVYFPGPMVANFLFCVFLAIVAHVFLARYVVKKFPQFGTIDLMFLIATCVVCVLIKVNERELYSTLEEFGDFHNSTQHWGAAAKPIAFGFVVFGYLIVNVLAAFVAGHKIFRFFFRLR